jgi:hypothetical protein
MASYHLTKARRLRDAVLKMEGQPGAQAAGQAGALLSQRVEGGRRLPRVEPTPLRRSRRGREGVEDVVLREVVLQHLMEGVSTEVFREWAVVAGP